MKLAWTHAAAQDRRDIRDFITRENPAASLELDELFSEKAKRLLAHPEMGRPGRVASTRELVIHRNYILVYDLSGDTLRILRVLHAAQQWPQRKNR